MKKSRCVYLTLVFASALVLGISAWQWYSAWSRLDTTLPPAGGLPLWIKIEVPHFRQDDPRWAADKIGATEETLAAVGCAVTSAAMVFGSYGIETDPARLNGFLNQHPTGYTPQGWIYWEAAAEISSATEVRLHYEDAPSFRLIDENLLRHNPVIARVRLRPDLSHFVVIVGKSGFDYLINDPLAPESPTLLKTLQAPIEALRFYVP